MTLLSIILLIWFHFIADFVFQSDYIAKNKSKDELVLIVHGILYSLPFFFFGATFALINMVAHVIVDFVTSRITSHLWRAGETHWFFVVIGFDQAIHMTTLMYTYSLLTRGVI